MEPDPREPELEDDREELVKKMPPQKLPNEKQEPCLNCSTPMNLVIHLYGICDREQQRVMIIGGQYVKFDPKKLSDSQLEKLVRKMIETGMTQHYCFMHIKRLGRSCSQDRVRRMWKKCGGPMSNRGRKSESG
jgi:hypothetical protein